MYIILTCARVCKCSLYPPALELLWAPALIVNSYNKNGTFFRQTRSFAIGLRISITIGMSMVQEMRSISLPLCNVAETRGMFW